MELEKNHRLMGMWMLLLRTVITKKKNEAWFVVNGIPIRYSMKEHALITGFDCNQFPTNYKRFGSNDFVERRFKRIVRIDKNNIKKALDKSHLWKGVVREDKLKMAVLYFLGTIIKPNKKTSKGYLDPFLLRVVDDLDECKTFPWGRLTFKDNINAIDGMMTRLKGSIPPTSTFHGFILPLELLAFECIPQLDQHFREDVDDVHIDCPRMCRRKFKSLMCKGFSLESIYEVLGTTKEIKSTLEVTPAEVTLLEKYVGTEDVFSDPVVDDWANHVDHGRNIWCEKLFDIDVATRTQQIPVSTPNLEAPVLTPNIEAPASMTGLEAPTREPSMVQNPATMKAILDDMKHSLFMCMGTNFKRVDEEGKMLKGEVEMLKGEMEMLKGQNEMLKGQVDMLERKVKSLESVDPSANAYGAGANYDASANYGASADYGASTGDMIVHREPNEFSNCSFPQNPLMPVNERKKKQDEMRMDAGKKRQGEKNKDAEKKKQKLNLEENILPENSKRTRKPGVQTRSPFQLGSV